jgi:hypothetical protein
MRLRERIITSGLDGGYRASGSTFSSDATPVAMLPLWPLDTRPTTSRRCDARQHQAHTECLSQRLKTAACAGVRAGVARRKPANHVIWHLFVLAASMTHFLAILWYSTPLYEMQLTSASAAAAPSAAASFFSRRYSLPFLSPANLTQSC